MLQNTLKHYNVEHFILVDKNSNIIAPNSKHHSNFIKDLLLPFDIPISNLEFIDGTYICIINNNNELFLILFFSSSKSYIAARKKFISFLFDFFISPPNIKKSNVEGYENKYTLELLFAQAVRNCDFEKIDWILPKIFNQEFPEGSIDITNPKFKSTLTFFVGILARISLQKGVSPTLALRLADSYLENDFKNLNLSSFALIKKITNDFVLLILAQRNSYSSEIVNNTMSYIQKNLYEPISVKKIAILFNITPEFLSTHFKEVTGNSLKSFIIKEKVNEAKFLLIFSNSSILDIALSLHFSDQTHFSKNFKKQTGLSPLQFRKSAKDQLHY